MDPALHPQLLEKIKTYQMPPAAVDLLLQNQPLLIAGPTAAGKETIIRAIQDAHNGSKVITHTTRAPREGEQNGIDYWFVSEEEMLELLNQDAMLEVKVIHAQQISGPSIKAYQDVLDQGLRPLLAVDTEGIAEITHQVKGIRPIFILPPSFETWMERLDRRGSMSHVERKRRLSSALNELESALNNEHFVLIVNHDIQQAAKEVLTGLSDPSTQAHNRELAQNLIASINAY